jgi:tetratricopeptide (TPR) repeat protein
MDSGTLEVITLSYNKGMQAFSLQDWSGAIENLEQAISTLESYPDKKAIVEPRKRFGPVFFTLGAAAFNLPDYPKSIKAFETFLTEWPTHEKVVSAKFALARACMADKRYEKAQALFAEMEPIPSLRDQALVAQAQCFKETGKAAEMTAALQKLVSGGVNNTVQASGALQLAQLKADAGEDDRLKELIDQLTAKRQFVENVVALNTLIVKLGDSLAGKDQYEQASRAYLKVMRPDQVKSFQKERIEFLERRIAANNAAAKQNPGQALVYQGQNSEFQSVLDQAKALLAEFEKLPDYMPSLMLRNARCWYGRDKKWESVLVNSRLIQLYPDAKAEVEAAMFSNVVSLAELLQVKLCQEACDTYFRAFPKGANAGTVAYIQGAVAMQAGDLKGAASLFGTMVETYPDGSFTDQMYMMQGSAHFGLGELDEALRVYNRYIAKFPQGAAIEEAKYRAAIIPVFQGKFEEGWKLVETFIKENPGSQHIEDARYRLMICKYAANLFEEVLADAADWEKDHHGGVMQPEVLCLKGDCLAALSRNEEAAMAYEKAAQNAASDEVLNYALNEASKLLQKLGYSAHLSMMWEEFIHQNPDHPNVVAGIYWISKAKSKDGNIDEAKQIIVAQLRKSLNNPKNESVELLLQQLSQLCWKRPRSKTPPTDTLVVAQAPQDGSDTATTSSTPTPEPAPLPPWDGLAELERVIEPLDAMADACGRARLNYGRAELLKLLKRQEEADNLMREIVVLKPQQLSPQLLALAGEYMQRKHMPAEATLFYQYLKENYLKSAWLDYAYTGLGDLALAAGDTKQALEHYTLACDEYAGNKLKESTMGKAVALMEQEKYAEAKKLFETIAGTKEWRGESTAQALYYLGEVERRQSHHPEAVAHFQRVFVAYQKYLPWVAKSYLRAAECFEKLGKRKEAVGHLQEMMRNEKLGLLPEAEQGRKLLLQWEPAR